MPKIQFTKGQGTGNDFILVLDRDGFLDLSEEEVAKLSKNLAALNAVYGNMLTAMNQPRN